MFVTRWAFINRPEDPKKAHRFRKLCSSRQDWPVICTKRNIELQQSPSYSKSSRRLSLCLGTSKLSFSWIPSSLWFSRRVEHAHPTGHVLQEVGYKILITTGNDFSLMRAWARNGGYLLRIFRKIWWRPCVIFTNAFRFLRILWTFL